MDCLGKRLKEAREQRGLTQEQVGDCLSLTGQAISNWERELNAPDPQTLKQLADLYRVSADYLLGVTTNDVIQLSGLTEQQKNCITRTIASFLKEK